MKYFILLLIIPYLALGASCDPNRKDYFCIDESTNYSSEMNVVAFHTIPFEIYSLFKEEIEQLIYPLKLDLQWQSPFFGAGVSFYDQNYRLMVLGGMSRMKEMTLDAYAAVICHEFSHLLGGEPRQTIENAEWASSEGQADFFAASVCLPRYFKFKKIPINEISKKIEKAGYEFTNLAMQVESKKTSIARHTIFNKKVNETLINRYPTLQCRYEQFRNPSMRASCWFKEY